MIIAAKTSAACCSVSGVELGGDRPLLT